ncbi:MAG TPA: SDR family NAD(P)-dependent oxidoreductase [Alphaproteobacteria bacterium]|nr:SDR family NAD(P)-dependent oxidoreductase [Alphaproteobacteria bacterium]
MSGRLAGRVALITGASRGIGAAVAKRYAAEGAHVILTARTVGGLEEVDDSIRKAGHGEATLVPLDLAKGAEIDKLGPAILERFGKLDILVGNAGQLGTLSPMGHIDPPVWDRVFAINTTANWRLIRICEPLLKLSPSGRAIFVTSGAADGKHPYWGAYAASKAALEVMVKTWASELAESKVKANLINPGATRTRMRAEAFPGEDAMKLKTGEDIAGTFVDLASASETRQGEIIRA